MDCKEEDVAVLAGAESRGKTKFAFVTLVTNDKMAPGALALGASLRETLTNLDAVCMASPDVSDSVKYKLGRVFDIVVSVPYIRHAVVKHAVTNEFEDDDPETSFTRFNMLDSEIMPYDQIMYLAPTTIVLRNIDWLFDIQAPAGVFSSPHAVPFERYGYANPYGLIESGTLIPYATIKAALIDSFVATGSTMMLAPSKNAFARVFEILGGKRSLINPGKQREPEEWLGTQLGKMSPPAASAEGKWGGGVADDSAIDGAADDSAIDGAADEPYGSSTCKSTFAEQLAAEIFQHDWRHIDQRFNWYNGYDSWLGTQLEKVINFSVKSKPWESDPAQWMDLAMWWFFAKKGGVELQVSGPIIRKPPGVLPIHYLLWRTYKRVNPKIAAMSVKEFLTFVEKNHTNIQPLIEKLKRDKHSSHAIL